MFCYNLVSLNNNHSNIRNTDMIVTPFYKLVANNFNMNLAVLQPYNEQFSQLLIRFARTFGDHNR